MFAEIFSPQVLIVLAIVAVLFGGAKLPELARSLGSAKAEFEKGQRGDDDDDDDKPAKDDTKDAKPETKTESKSESKSESKTDSNTDDA